METVENTDNAVLAKWNQLKALLDELELDVVKNARGVAAAGVRTRKGLRALKVTATELVKLTVELDKSRKATRAPRAGRPAGFKKKKALSSLTQLSNTKMPQTTSEAFSFSSTIYLRRNNMPAPRAVLADLLQYGLDPTKEYKITNANGRLGKDGNVALSTVIPAVVEPVIQPVVSVVEPVEIKQELVQEIEQVQEETQEEVLSVETDVKEELPEEVKSIEAPVDDFTSKSTSEVEDEKIPEKVVEKTTKKHGKKSLDK